MIERIEFNKHIFSRDTESPNYQRRVYFRRKIYLGKKYLNGKSKNKIYKWVFLHREIWSSYFGPVPWDYVIYHISGDVSDNDILNLGCCHEKTRAPWDYRIHFKPPKEIKPPARSGYVYVGKEGE